MRRAGRRPPSRRPRPRAWAGCPPRACWSRAPPRAGAAPPPPAPPEDSFEGEADTSGASAAGGSDDIERGGGWEIAGTLRWDGDQFLALYTGLPAEGGGGKP